MQAGSSPVQARARHRHELRTLTYVTLDQANGGIVRNLTHDGIAVQAVAAVRPRQQLRVRFELRYPRLRVEARGEVVWSTFSGQCGIRFLDLSPRVSRMIDEWIFGDLLEGGGLSWDRPESVLIGSPPLSVPAVNSALPAPVALPTPLAVPLPTGEQSTAVGRAVQGVLDDGLIVSPGPVKVIELPVVNESPAVAQETVHQIPFAPTMELDWLSQPLSGRSLAWTVNALIVLAALLLSVLVFLSVTGEAPRWPTSMTTGAAIVVMGMYWAFFKIFGGASFGERLARLAEAEVPAEEEANARFR